MSTTPQSIGRYLLCDEIAAGGMATVHLGRVVGPAGFSRTVAIKKMHPHHAREPEFAAMFLDEARLAARIHHPNVVATLDVVARGGDLFIVMEYVEGETLARLSRAARSEGGVPQRIALAVLAAALSGLHAAHEATGERREALSIVHRDVSPQNLMIGVDGVTRVLDFGIAKAAARLESTRGGQVKGKLRYMSPEQIRRQPLDQRTDVYAAGVVLWEVLTGRRLFTGEDAGSILHEILTSEAPPPSSVAPDVSPEVDAIVKRALARDPDARFATALEMAEALERAKPLATPREIGAWVVSLAHGILDERRERIVELESRHSTDFVSHETAASPRRRTRADDPTELDGAPSAVPAASVVTARTEARARGWVAGLFLLVIGVAAVLFFTQRPTASARTEPPPPAVSIAASVAESAVPSLASTSEPREERARVTKPTAGARPSSKPTPKTKPKSGCVPPYVMEADGTKRYKSECL